MKATTFKVYAHGIFGLWALVYQDTDKAKCKAVAAQYNKAKVLKNYMQG